MSKHSTGATYTSMWDEMGARLDRAISPRLTGAAHSTGEPAIPFYAREGAGTVRILPDPSQGVETPMVGVPVGMPI